MTEAQRGSHLLNRRNCALLYRAAGQKRGHAAIPSGIGALWAAHLEVSLTPTMKARFLIEAQGALTFGARRQQGLIAVGLPGQIECVSKNPSSKSRPPVTGVRDNILDHRI